LLETADAAADVAQLFAALLGNIRNKEYGMTQTPVFLPKTWWHICHVCARLHLLARCVTVNSSSATIDITVDR
jgi:hypothetical protein